MTVSSNETAALSWSLKPAFDLRLPHRAGMRHEALIGASSDKSKPSLRLYRGKSWETHAKSDGPEYLLIPRLIEHASGDTSVREEWSLQSFTSEYDFARKKDWDGAGARPITGEVLISMAYLLNSIPPLPPPSEVTPLSDGALSIVWEKPAGYLFIAVGPKNALHVYFDIPGLGNWEHITFLGNAVARRQVIAAARAIGYSQSIPKTDETNLIAELIAA